MNRKRGFKERIAACLMAALMVVGVVPLDFAGMGVQEAKADGTVYTLDMSNITGHEAQPTDKSAWTAKDKSDYFTVYSKSDGGSTVSSGSWTDSGFDGYTATGKFSTGGGAKVGQACIGFTTTASTNVTVYWYTKDAARQLKVIDPTGTQKAITERTAAGYYKDTFELTEANTYYVGSSNSAIDIFGVVVEEQSATGEKISAEIRYDGDALVSLSGKYDADQITLKASEDQIVFTQEPNTEKITLATLSDNVYSGTSSLKAAIDTDNKKIVVKKQR